MSDEKFWLQNLLAAGMPLSKQELKVMLCDHIVSIDDVDYNILGY